MIKTMNYINLSDLAAALEIETKTDFQFFWDTEDNNGAFLCCDAKTLKSCIDYLEYLLDNNLNHRYITKLRNQIDAINLLRTKYGITDKIFVYFD